MGLFKAALRCVVVVAALCLIQIVFGASSAQAQAFVCTVTAADYSALSVANPGTGARTLLFNSDGIYNWTNARANAAAICADNAAFGEASERLDVWDGDSFEQGGLGGRDFTTTQGGTIRLTQVNPIPYDTVEYTPPSPSFTGTDTFYMRGAGVGLRLDITVGSPPAPTVTGVSPGFGLAGTTTSNVVITGTNFTGATAVTFGGTTATYVVNSATQITATAPSRSAGAANVVVTRGSASAVTGASVFTYFSAPTISAAFSPTSITSAGTSTLTLTLTNPNGSQALSGLAVAAASLPANLTGSGPATSCSGGTATYVGGTRALSLSGATLAGGAACTVTLTVASTVAGTYSYTTGAVSVSGPAAATGSTATTPTALTVTAPPVANSFTASAIAYNTGSAAATGISVAGSVTGSVTSYAVGSATTAQGGSVSINNAGLASYAPPVGFRGNDSFAYTASGPGGTSNSATVTVPVSNPTLVISLVGSGQQNIALSGVQINTTGGQAPYSCGALASGALPSGVTLNADCTLTGTPTDSGAFTFTAPVTDSSTGAGPFTQTSGTLTLNIAAQPSVSIAVSPASVSEDGAANLTYTVTRSAASASALTVNLATTGTATSGTDYSGASATATILANATTATVVVDPAVDAQNEADETVIVTVTAGTGYTVGAPSAATGTILNDDAQPSLSINDVTVAEGNAGTATAAFTVSLSVASGQTVTVSYATADGTAVAPGDYAAASGLLTFNPGVTTQPVSVAVNGDTTVETDEGFTVGLSAASNASISDNSGAGTITNDDIPSASIAISPVSVAEDGATNLTYMVTLDRAPAVTTTVNFTVGGTASEGGDYAAIGTTAGFGIGQTTANVVVDPSTDTTVEADETVVVTLAAGTGYSVGAPASQTGTIANDDAPDTTPPVAPVITAPANGAATNDNTPTITGTAEASSSVEVQVDAVAIGTVTADGAGAWTLTASTLADGSRVIRARATDASTNTGPFSATTTITVDTAAPAAPAVTTPAAGATTSTSPTITGSAEANAQVLVSVDGTVTTVTANGSGAWSFAPGALAPGPHTTSAQARDAAGNTSTASAVTNFTAAASAVSGLSNLSLSAGSLSPAFSTGGLAYTASVANGVNAVTVTPTVVDAASVARVNGAITASGAASAPVALAIGVNTITVVVTAENGVATTSYTIQVTRAASSVSSLSALTLSAGTLSPVFGAGVTSYTAAVSTGTASITVTPTVTDATATVAVNGAAVASGAPSGAIALAAGANAISIVVTAQDGVTMTTYALSLTRGQVAPTLALNPATLPNGQVGVGYSQTAAASGGQAPYSYAVTAGALPGGLTLAPATGVVSGTPSASGAFNVSITATDSSTGTGPFTVTRAYALTIDPAGVVPPVSPPVVPLAVVLSPAGGSLAAGTVGATYSQGLAASGAVAPYAFTVTGGALPPGLSLAADGTVSGTPTTSGAFGVTVRATDATPPGSGGPYSASATYAISVTGGGPPLAAASSLTVAFNAGATAAPLALSGGAATSLVLTSAPTRGTATINGVTIVYTPTPGTYGADGFAYTATGAGGVSAPAMVTVTVTPPALTIAPTSLPNGQEDIAYSAALTASGGTAPYALTVTGGVLPAGLTLSGAGLLSGTPTVAGAYGFTVTATDTSTGAGPARVSQTFALTIAAPPPPVARPGPAVISSSGGQPTRIDLSALVVGDFDEIRIADGPQNGTVVLETGGAAASKDPEQPSAAANPRVIAVYAARSGFVGTDGFSFVAVGPGGASPSTRITLTVAGPAPAAANLTASTDQGRPVTIDLTGAASQGPFTSATVVSITPTGSAGAALVEGGVATARTYGLTITPRVDFEGTVVVRYTIGNSFGLSLPAAVTVTVRPRPDPSADPTVRALTTAQAQASRLFATTQLGNFNRRNEALRGGSEGRGQGLGLSLTSGFVDLNDSPLDTLPWADRERRPAAERDMLSQPTRRAEPSGRGSGTAQADEAPPTTDGDTGPRQIGSLAVWSGGAVTFGGFDQTRRTARFDITTSGVSAGADVKLGDGLIVGAGAGFGTQRTDIGEDDDGRLDGESWSGAVYGSWRPASGTFIDGVAGYGALDFETRRRTAGGAVARGRREGDAAMASITGGWDWTPSAFALSTYGRFDYVSTRLDAYSETGAGIGDLRFAEREFDSLAGTLGVRGQRVRLLRDGVVRHSGRLEWRHEFNGMDGQGLDYADVASLRYSLDGERWPRDEIAAELGLEVTYDNGLSLGADVGASFSEAGEAATLRLLLAKRF